jgi:uncharacterized protein YndB with AHSA1/START domain
VTESIRRQLDLPYSREEVWQEIASDTGLAEWMYPNDFVAKVGHRFKFHVPANPSVGFEGLEVSCEVLECERPGLLVFSWSAGGLLEGTKVSFRLVETAHGTRLQFEHSGFDLDQPLGKRAFGGAKFGWEKMFDQLQLAMAAKKTSAGRN